MNYNLTVNEVHMFPNRSKELLVSNYLNYISREGLTSIHIRGKQSSSQKFYRGGQIPSRISFVNRECLESVLSLHHRNILGKKLILGSNHCMEWI